MQNPNWLEDTVPTPRTPAESGGQGLAGVPARVWVLAGLVLLVALAACGLWAMYLLGDRVPSGEPTPAPIFWTSSPAPTPTATPTETPAPPPTTSPDIAIGRYVQVAGTASVGLSLREGPGSNYARMDIAAEGEVFIVIAGPEVAAGYEWWKVRDPDNEEREWWAAGNFLEPVAHP